MNQFNLPIIEHIEQSIVGHAHRRIKPKPPAGIDLEGGSYELNDGITPHNIRLRHHLTVSFEQSVPHGLDSDPKGKLQARQRAARAIARYLFQPIEQEIREILEIMWNEGDYNTEAAERLDAMLPALRGERPQQ